MSLFAELKRRKVFKVAAGYLVVAWLVIQVGATVAPQLGLPDWAPRLITLIVLLGLPVAVVIAWLTELTPEGLRLERAPKGNKRVFFVAALLVAAGVGWFVHALSGDVGLTGSNARLGAASTAVLPFLNLSSRPEDEYFSDGLSETLLHQLAQVPKLKVAARTSSFSFPRQAGRCAPHRRVARRGHRGGRQRAAFRRDGPHHRATGAHRRWVGVVVAQLRSPAGRSVRDPGRDRFGSRQGVGR